MLFGTTINQVFLRVCREWTGDRALHTLIYSYGRLGTILGILEMSMNEAFIWLSGHRIIDREIFNH